MLWTLKELCLDCNPLGSEVVQWTLKNSKNKIWLASDGRMMNSCSEKLYLCGITRAAHFYCAQLVARSYWTKECFGSLFYSDAQCSALRPNDPENMWINFIYLNAARLDRIQSTLSTDATGESEIYQSFKVLIVVVAVRLRSLSVRCFWLFVSFLSLSLQRSPPKSGITASIVSLALISQSILSSPNQYSIIKMKFFCALLTAFYFDFFSDFPICWHLKMLSSFAIPNMRAREMLSSEFIRIQFFFKFRRDRHIFFIISLTFWTFFGTTKLVSQNNAQKSRNKSFFLRHNFRLLWGCILSRAIWGIRYNTQRTKKGTTASRRRWKNAAQDRDDLEHEDSDKLRITHSHTHTHFHLSEPTRVDSCRRRRLVFSESSFEVQ